MRIISGTSKGRRLTPLPANCKSIRPTTDRAREAIFSIIGNEIHNCNVLDLYSGSGAFGLEAYSRGAKSVTFVDNSKLSLSLIQKNCSLCFPEHTDNIRIFRHNLSKSLSFSSDLIDDFTTFQIIFLDPPYDKGLASKTLHHLDDHISLQTNCMVIAEEKTGVSLIAPPFNTLSFKEKRKYGDSTFWLFRAI